MFEYKSHTCFEYEVESICNDYAPNNWDVVSVSHFSVRERFYNNDFHDKNYTLILFKREKK